MGHTEDYSRLYMQVINYHSYTWDYVLGSFDPERATCFVRLMIGGANPYDCEFGLYTPMRVRLPGKVGLVDFGSILAERDRPALMQALADGMYEVFGLKDAPHDKPGVKTPRTW